MRKIIFRYKLYERDKYLPKNADGYDRQSISSDIPGQYQLEALEKQVISIIDRDLPRDCYELFDLKVKTEVLRVDYGSMTVFFAVGMAAYTAISQYKSFFESSELIYDHFQYLIGRKLPRRYRDFYHEDLSRLNHRSHRKGRIFIDGPFDHYEGEFEHLPRKRGGFPWLVFVLSMIIAIETVGIGLLVYQAVMKTYFP